MTTIKKKSYQPPTVELVSIDNALPLLDGSKLDITIEDDAIDIVDQDAPLMIDLDVMEL